MKKLLKRLFIISFPLLLAYSFLTYLYFKRDPYFDFGTYKNYSWKYVYQSLGDLSTKKLLISKKKYNSFIFGSSRTAGLYACYLQKKIKNSIFFHYANWSETIGGICAKMELLDSLGYKLDNIFIYIDDDYTFAYSGYCNAGFDHYLLTKENKYSYYFNHFKSFVFPPYDIDKIKILLGYQSNSDIIPFKEYDLETNDLHLCTDSLIINYGNCNMEKSHIKKIDSLKKCGFLYKRSVTQKYNEKQISLNEEQILRKIKALLDKHKSKYYIVITPLYDQFKLDTSDIQFLNKLFGKNVYDFSGINNITNNEYNYPDRKHFLPYISKIIVDSIVINKQ